MGCRSFAFLPLCYKCCNINCKKKVEASKKFSGALISYMTDNKQKKSEYFFKEDNTMNI